MLFSFACLYPAHQTRLIVNPDHHSIFEEAFSKHYHELEAHLRNKTGSPDLAADLIQDTFIRFKKTLETSSSVGNIRAYLFRIARNLLIDHHRKTQSQNTESVDGMELDNLHHPTDNPARLLEHQERLMNIQKAIDRLPARSREVFLMARVQGMSFVEIGASLGISPKTAFSHMTRALVTLKSLLDDNNDL